MRIELIKADRLHNDPANAKDSEPAAQSLYTERKSNPLSHPFCYRDQVLKLNRAVTSLVYTGNLSQINSGVLLFSQVH